jgi:hypothetical protein
VAFVVLYAGGCDSALLTVRGFSRAVKMTGKVVDRFIT